MTNVTSFIDKIMKPSFFQRFFLQEDLNFLLTNRVPRLLLTRWMGWFSHIQSPLLARLSIRVWRLFTHLDLSDARQQHFASLHDCFTRELLPGARVVDPDPAVLCSPSDGIVGACGRVVDGMVLQAKGFPYSIGELFGPSQDPSVFRNGSYITLRLTSSMYHRFHAPQDMTVEHVTYLSGDTWNVNPIALARVERLFCRNERAVLRARLKATAASRSRWCRWQRFWWPASGCIFWTCCCTCATAAPTRCPALPAASKARSWAGLSMAPPSSCSPRRALTCVKASRPAGRSGWGRA